ncbi:hypothetical protein [Streptomyces flaveolus]|uniref:hypothetical protein n=1 Tax=Streptomyces flaveolus TaxID=67297 RepID=UPI00166FA13B|nr:hypothetical protein [Streptomyces flaveolus]GGQ78832.1 hypothetical protein GCM10010216_45890 [Streptomyces flaveolus]
MSSRTLPAPRGIEGRTLVTGRPATDRDLWPPVARSAGQRVRRVLEELDCPSYERIVQKVGIVHT